MTIRNLFIDEITPALFQGFERRQEVTQCWRKVDGQWALRDIAFTEEWGEAEFREIALELRETLKGGGRVIAVLEDDGRLAGFASLEGERFGARGEYVILSCMQISRPRRGMGWGRGLFAFAAEQARDMGAEKLYISAHSSRESQAFYRKMGCVDAVEIHARLAEKEPCDCQMEFIL